MNFTELQKTARKLYHPALLLEESFSHRIRRKVFAIFRLFTFVLGCISLFILTFFWFTPIHIPLSSKVFGLFLLSLCFSILLFLLEAFYFSYLSKEPKTNGLSMDFDVAFCIYKTLPQDITASFFNTDSGRLILLRCGIALDTFKAFLDKRTPHASMPIGFIYESSENNMTLSSYVSAIVASDTYLADFLFSYGIQKRELIGITEWIAEAGKAIEARERWWADDHLSRISGIGQDWSYGRAYTLEKYKRSLPPVVSMYTIHSTYGTAELKELEAVLSRKREGNVVLVGNDRSGVLDVVARLSALIEEGKVVHELKRKHIVLLDNDMLVSHTGSKSKFENEFILLLKESINAGNIILVIEDLPAFISSGNGLGSDVVNLIEPYLSHPNLQVIALSDTDRFHSLLEKNVSIMQNFETILMKELDENNTIRVLQNELIRFENQGFFFTYPALVAVVDCAERYFPDGTMPDKAIDLLTEIVPKLSAQKKHLVEKTDVLSLVEVKTGIPTGAVTEVEKSTLMNLEDILHKRIVGQEQAIKVISSAVRRARSGINNPNRPLGSFLFLGPTGVGKTETTKALADVFFGSVAHIMRLDMSEYSSSDAISKLIGSFESKQEGVLSSMLREHQYGVLLLDEFEKTTKEVMNLFLQILDEGFFSDMSGKKVMARNLIIIATSNAGSDLIWSAVQSGSDLSASKDMIIEAIVKQGIFKPELLNRFDGIVVFHPLGNDHLRKIGELMLKKLHDRLAERGMNLVVDQTLIDFVVSHGTDPKFGARPMNRAIQEKVEQIIADKIIRGDITSGTPITLTPVDLNIG